MINKTMTMNKETKKDLIRAGDDIAKGEYTFICGVIGDDWKKSEEAKMFDPGTFVWWGYQTMDEPDHTSKKNARLLCIAFMITMPKELL